MRAGRLLAALPFLLVALAAFWRIALGEVYAARDVWRLTIPDSALLRRLLLAGEWPLWNPHLFLGQPFLATLQAQALYPLRVLPVLAFGPYWGPMVEQLLHVALAAAGAWLVCRRLRLPPSSAAIAALCFGLSPLSVELANAANLHGASAWTGWIVLAALRRSGRPLRDAALLAVPVSLSFLCGAPELLLGQLALAALVAGSRGGALRVAGAGLWALLLCAAVALPALEFARHSLRAGGETQTLAWSARPLQLLALGIPNLDLPRRGYFHGDQWLLIQLFLGTASFVLALFGAARWRRSWRWSLGAVGFALLALGKYLPPAGWLLSLTPFRYPAKALALAAFCVAILAAFGWTHLARARPASARAALAAPLIALGLGALLRDWRPAWVGVALLALWGAARLPPRLAASAIPLLVALELALFHLFLGGYGWARVSELSRPSPFAAHLQADPARLSVDRAGYYSAQGEPETVELTTGRDAATEQTRARWEPNRFVEDGVEALEGYGAPEPERILEFHFSPQRSFHELAGVGWYLRRGEAPFPDLERVAEVDGAILYRSSSVLPRARVVHRARVLEDAAALEELSIAAPRDEVLLAEGADPVNAPCEGSTVRQPEPGRYLLDSCGPGYLVLADAYYPGWTAEVDGEQAPVLRANYALRAIPVPGGASTVVVRYRPLSFRLGGLLSLAALLALGLALRTPETRKAARGPPSRTS